jgi:hypothetical protein
MDVIWRHVIQFILKFPGIAPLRLSASAAHHTLPQYISAAVHFPLDKAPNLHDIISFG